MCLRVLQKGYDAQDLKEWDSWVHKLYGACSHIGAVRLAQICDEGQALKGQDYQEISRLHGLILQEHSQLCDALKAKLRA